MNIFIICGYGIPENIKTDQNYPIYLSVVFNTIFSRSRNKATVIIPSGGATSCAPPFKGTEGKIMAEFLQELMHRDYTKAQTGEWQVMPEEQSLSTLENLLLCKKIIEARALQGPITIFYEITKTQRIKTLAQKIFAQQTGVESIDFDVSKNRYLNQEILDRRERMALEESLWTLESPDRLPTHHEFFEKKLEFLRSSALAGVSHVDAVEEWTKRMPEIIRELMPDHPLIKNF
jgi:hypothetical protein